MVILQTALLFTVLFPFTRSINTYNWTPSNWTAGTASSLSLVTDLSSPNSIDAAYDNLTIFLSAFDTNISLWSFCHLSPALPITISPITLTIPPSIAPENNILQFALGIKQIKKDLSADRYQYTYPFTVAGLNGVWSNYEVNKGDITPPGLQDKMPCSAYPCARDCVSKHVASDLARPSDDQKGAWDCIAACDGVEYPQWEVYTSSVLHQASSVAASISTATSVFSSTMTATSISTSSLAAAPISHKPAPIIPDMKSNSQLLESADVVTAVVTSVSVSHVRASASATSTPAKSAGLCLGVQAVATLCTVVVLMAVMM